MNVIALPLTLLLASALLSSVAAQPNPPAGSGLLPLHAPVAGTPEAGVLAGLPQVTRMASESLIFERRVRTTELARLRSDLGDIRMKLSAAGTSSAPLAGSLRVTLVGSMNREATIAARVAQVERELSRRGVK